MTGSFPNFAFDPADPRIEPGDCIEWDSAAGGATHSATDSACPDGSTCSSPPPPGCVWETGNVAATDPTVVCFYDPGQFPPDTIDPYYCRIHATPTSGSMRGNMRITTAIVLSIDKDVNGADILASWTGGGIAGDETFRVVESTNDPTFASASTTTLTPNNGSRSHRFTGELATPLTRYYLVRNRQPDE